MADTSVPTGEWLARSDWPYICTLKRKYANPPRKQKRVIIIPAMDSCRTDHAQKIRMTMVIGIAAIVIPNSASVMLMMITRN